MCTASIKDILAAYGNTELDAAQKRDMDSQVANLLLYAGTNRRQHRYDLPAAYRHAK